MNSQRMMQGESCDQGCRSVVKIGSPNSFLTLLFSTVYPLSLPPLPLEVGPLKCSQGSAVSSPYGVLGRAPAEIKFCTFLSQKSEINDCNHFPDNQLAKFRAV